MKKSLVMAVIGIFMMGLACGYVRAQTEDSKAPVNAGNTACPVLGTKVEPGKALTVEYNGKLYNVCCPMCVGEFKKNPEKYAAVAEKKGS